MSRDETIWEAFDRVLKEHGPIEHETVQEAAKRYCDSKQFSLFSWTPALLAFVDGAIWAAENPAALPQLKRMGEG